MKKTKILSVAITAMMLGGTVAAPIMTTSVHAALSVAEQQAQPVIEKIVNLPAALGKTKSAGTGAVPAYPTISVADVTLANEAAFVSAVISARASYNALTTQAAKDAVTNIAALDAAEGYLKTFVLTNRFVALGMLTPASGSAVADAVAIAEARQAYDALGAMKTIIESSATSTTQVDMLMAKETAIQTVVSNMITGIGTVTLAKEDTHVVPARLAYNALSSTLKVGVPNVATLVAAEAALNTAKVTAGPVAAKIITFPATITLSNAGVVLSARQGFNALTTLAKEYVNATNEAILLDAETTLAGLVDGLITTVDAYTLNDIKTVTPAMEKAIADARAAYNGLSDEAKAQTTGYDAVTTSVTFKDNTKLKAVETELQTLKDEVALAKLVVVLAAVPVEGKVTLSDEANVVAARQLYDGLSVTAKESVYYIDYIRLLAAEKSILTLKAAAAKAAAEAAAVKAAADKAAADAAAAAAIKAPAKATSLKATTTKVTGKATKGATVTIYKYGTSTKLGTATVTSKGTFSAKIKTQKKKAKLSVKVTKSAKSSARAYVTVK